ncbi:MAG TPA: phage holin family protein [Anaerolineae bacterium]
MRRIRNVILRFAFVWVLEGVSLLAMTLIIPGIRLEATPATTALDVAMAVALVLGVINVLVRPFLLLLTLPINVRTLGFSTLIINALMIGLTAYLLPGFHVDGLGPALLGALVLAAANTALTHLTTIDDDDSFFEDLVERLSVRQQMPGSHEPGRGIVLLEIDGLSYGRMCRAADEGFMPAVRDMLRSGAHVLSPYDCGLPSQTSACQAGIMYGDNDDIPAFRWYDKQRGKMLVSNNFHDAHEINARYAKGRGLLRGGSSINNLTSGDAAKTILTMSTLTGSAADAERRRQEDFYLYWLNPYVFMRSLVLSIWDILVELGQGLRQRIRNVQPRINRLEKGYPFLRVITNVLLRDIGTYMVALDVIRGVPAIYTTYVGYDEVAHHAGPDTRDAMNTLRSIDAQIRRIRNILARKASRPYDLFVLSDHGQSSGATFRQRYGQTLAQLIDGLIEPEMKVAEADTTAAGARYTAALVAELHGVEQRELAGRIGRRTLSRTRRTLENRAKRHETASTAMGAEAVVCVSGNLAHVYFKASTDKLTLSELQSTYPGLVDALVEHEGVGFVVVLSAEGEYLALGKGGARNLETGIVTGTDPLSPHGNADLRAAQLLRMARFPHAGDLILNSTLYPDGSVAAFEELVGNHGGLGGEQTDAFILHPADMSVPPTSNAVEVFRVFNARRGLPAERPPLPRPRHEINAWSLPVLRAGLRDWRTWIPQALRVLRLDRPVFREVAFDPYATGPGVLILLAAAFTQATVIGPAQFTPQLRLIERIAVGLLGWLLIALAGHAAGRFLRGSGRFTYTARALMFAMTPQVLSVLRLIPVIGPLLNVAVSAVSVLAVWMALQEALGVHGRRAALLPIVAVAIAVLSVVVLGLMINGVAITGEAILLLLGIGPGQ